MLGDHVRVGKKGMSSAAAAFDPFEGMQTYSQRYRRKKRMIPKLDTRPYGSSLRVFLFLFICTLNLALVGGGMRYADEGPVLKFFPKELWSTIDPSATEVNGVISSDNKGKALQAFGLEKEVEGEAEDELDVKEDREEDDDEEGLEEGEEEVDDEFEDEEDGGDYNAEQYFDDGGDDAGDDLDGGRDEGSYFE